MKMKRTVKAAIAASMAVAVFGVGAVSFAAWTSSTEETLTISGTTGTITAAENGFQDVSNWEYASFMDGILPYDQSTSGYMATAELPVILLGEWDQSDVKLTMAMTTQLSAVGDEVLGAYSFYYKLYTYSQTNGGGDDGDGDGEGTDAASIATQAAGTGITCPKDQSDINADGWVPVDDPNGFSLAGLGALNDTNPKAKTLSKVGIAVIYVSSSFAQKQKAFAFELALDNPTA